MVISIAPSRHVLRRLTTTTAAWPSAAWPSARPLVCRRCQSTAQNPLRVDPTIDEQILRLANRDVYPLSLFDLVRNGRPPLSAEALLKSANFASSLIPIRLAHRIRALRNLPFILVSNPYISRIHSIYLHSLTTLLPFLDHEITSLEEEIRFTDVLADLVQQHANTIPIMARGFLESRRYIDRERVTKFLDEHLRARISTRLLAEQHIALHLSSVPHAEKAAASPSGQVMEVTPPDPSYIGIIDTALRPATILQQTASFVGDLCEFKYGVRPTMHINGRGETTIAYIPSHLEYIFTELLKNAFRATIESRQESYPIEVTIAVAKPKPQEKTLDVNIWGQDGPLVRDPHEDDEAVTIRIRDRGGGIAPKHLPYIWGYSFTTFRDKPEEEHEPDLSSSPIEALDTLSNLAAGGSSIAGLGYGLPLSRAYAEHFGGGVQLQSLWGWGTDLYLRLHGLRGF